MAGLRLTEAKSLLRKSKRVDSWFLSCAGMNIYRGCAHDCAYCDGRAETCRVEGAFGRDIVAKTNAPDLLRHQLDPSRRRRKPLPRGSLFLGGGVGDAYQPAEARRGRLDVPLSSIRDRWSTLRSVGPATEKIIGEIVDHGTSSLYAELLG